VSSHHPSRRDLLRAFGGSVLGASAFGFGLADCSLLRAASAPRRLDAPGFARAKRVILVFLQGGPSHLDLWDPKEDVPDDVRSPFRTIASKVPGMEVTELLPRLAAVTDKLSFIRSMSYQPDGLFNHTAAHYQMLTGYTADKVSPSGQLEPPTPKDYPNVGCNVVKLRPPDVPMLPFVMLPRPLQESNVIGKAGTADFLGRGFDPYVLYPPGDDLDESKMERVQVADLALRQGVAGERARVIYDRSSPARLAPGPIWSRSAIWRQQQLELLAGLELQLALERFAAGDGELHPDRPGRDDVLVQAPRVHAVEVERHVVLPQ
jgi:hypothetical protein